MTKYCNPLTNSSAEIKPSDHHFALNLTQSGISCSTVKLLVPVTPTSMILFFIIYSIPDAKSRNRISKKQYAFTREGRVVLDSELIRKFLEILERVFQKERRYDYKFGLKTRDGLKSVQEIVIAKIVVQKLSDYCLDSKLTPEPIKIGF